MIPRQDIKHDYGVLMETEYETRLLITGHRLDWRQVAKISLKRRILPNLQSTGVFRA